MTRMLLTFILWALGAVGFAQCANATSAAELLSDCKGFEQVMVLGDKKMALPTANIEIWRCAGYFEAFQALVSDSKLYA